MPTGEIYTIGSSVGLAAQSEPEPHLGGIKSRYRVAACSAAPPRSTASSTCAAIRATTTTGVSRATPDGIGRACSPIHEGRILEGSGGPQRGTTAPCARRSAAIAIRSIEAFLEAGQQAGYAQSRLQQRRSGRLRPEPVHAYTCFPLRCSAARAYLWPAMRRSNLTVWTGANARRVLLEGKRAVGVEVAHRGETLRSTRSARSSFRRSLSLAAAPDALGHRRARGGSRRTASRSSTELPGVGSNLQDHFGSFVQHRCTEPVTYFSLRRPVELAAHCRFVLTGSGPLAVFPMNAMAFLKSDPALERPTCSFICSLGRQSEPRGRSVAAFHGYSIHWCNFRPESRGHLSCARPIQGPTPHLPQLPRLRARPRCNRRAFRIARELHAKTPSIRSAARSCFRGPRSRAMPISIASQRSTAPPTTTRRHLQDGPAR